MSSAMTHYTKGINLKQPNGRDACPDYDSAVHRSNSNTTTGSRSVHWPSSQSPESSVAALSIRRPSPPLAKKERYIYTYKLLAGSTPLEFFISVEPASGKPSPGKYTFRLSLKANGIEREICDQPVLRLSVDPRRLEFVVFVFPGKACIPAGSRQCLRVWLRVNGIDHRVFSDDELWIGKDLDFYSIAEAAIMLLRSVDSKSQVYHGHIGRALVSFICRWHRVKENLYKYSLDYEANGVGANLFDDLMLRVDGDPRTLTFLIYSVPITSIPVGSSHHLRVWIKTLGGMRPNTPPSFHTNDSYIYQRVWKSETFKIGARLDFESMSGKATMGFSVGAPQTIVTSTAPRTPPPPASSIGSVEEKSLRRYQ